MTVLIWSASASADGYAEVWKCSPGGYYSESRIVVTATISEGRKFGEIAVAGTSHVAEFMVSGFNRRWDFGSIKNGVLQYAFIIWPSGSAGYYDFTLESSGKPEQVFFCKLQ